MKDKSPKTSRPTRAASRPGCEDMYPPGVKKKQKQYPICVNCRFSKLNNTSEIFMCNHSANVDPVEGKSTKCCFHNHYEKRCKKFEPKKEGDSNGKA